MRTTIYLSLPKRPKRSGYALLLCLLVAAVCSVAVLGIFQIARFETLEVAAKKSASVADWSARAGTERAIALLMTNPDLRGEMPPLKLQATVTTLVDQSGEELSIRSTATLNGIQRLHSTKFTVTQLKQRIAAVPL